MLDEPHAGLDAPSRGLLGQLIADAVADGATVLLSSHEPQLSVPLADRVVTMGGGRVTGEEPGGRRAGVAALCQRRHRPDRATTAPSRRPMWHDAVLVAGKDLRIEARSAGRRCGRSSPSPCSSSCCSPSPSARTSRRCATPRPGIFWVALLFSTVLAIQRSVAVESGEGTRDGLRLSGIDPAGIFLGKAAAVGVQLLALQLVLWAGVTFLFDVRVHAVWLAVVGQPAGHGRPGLCRCALRRALGRAARA